MVGIKDEKIMIARVIAFCLLSICSSSLWAQLPSARFSPINYFGRYHGFGYSDGYHACKDGRCGPTSGWKPWESMSSFYGSPTPPPANRLISAPNVYSGRASFQSVSIPDRNFVGAYDVAPNQMQYYTPSAEGMSSTRPMPSMQHLAPTPAMASPAGPTNVAAPVPTTPQTPSLYELVPSVPNKSASPSDQDLLDLPAPQNRDLVPPAPNVQSRRTPPGSHSLIHPSMFRKP